LSGLYIIFKTSSVIWSIGCTLDFLPKTQPLKISVYSYLNREWRSLTQINESRLESTTYRVSLKLTHIWTSMKMRYAMNGQNSKFSNLFYLENEICFDFSSSLFSRLLINRSVKNCGLIVPRPVLQSPPIIQICQKLQKCSFHWTCRMLWSKGGLGSWNYFVC